MRDTHRSDEYELESTVDEAAVVDHALGALAATSRAHELELARWLLRAEALAVHRRFGFASLAEYVDRRLGLSARELREKLRVARALSALPALTEALRTGEQSWSAVRELTRVATPETEAEWLGFSRGRTVRQLERKVSLHQRGESPRAPRTQVHAPRRMVFEVAPEDLGTVRAAIDVLWQELGGAGASLTPGRMLVAMAEVVLGRRAVESAAYQTSVTVCAGCARTWQRAGGERVEVSDAVAGCARCDGEVVGLAEVAAEDDVLAEEGVPAGEVTTHVGHDDPTLRRAPAESHAAGPTHADAATHVGHEPPEPAPAEATSPEAAALAHLRQLTAQGGARPLLRLMTRALGVPLRSLTPQLRRLVFARDGGRCIVPGCKHWRFIDVHHVVPRAARGPHRLDNLACLCTAHHRAVHEGVLAIEGSATSGWVVRHAGAGVYGRAWG
jgi:hypothetical protein